MTSICPLLIRCFAFKTGPGQPGLCVRGSAGPRAAAGHDPAAPAPLHRAESRKTAPASGRTARRWRLQVPPRAGASRSGEAAAVCGSRAAGRASEPLNACNSAWHRVSTARVKLQVLPVGLWVQFRS